MAKINGIAKDFGIAAKDLVALLDTVGIKKNVGGTIEGEEYEIFLALITAQNQIENLEDYLSGKATLHSDRPKAEPKAETPAPHRRKPPLPQRLRHRKSRHPPRHPRHRKNRRSPVIPSRRITPPRARSVLPRRRPVPRRDRPQATVAPITAGNSRRHRHAPSVVNR